MENFSTPALAVLPRLANVATLAVMVAATWWSGAQRPGTAPTEALVTPAAQPAVVPVIHPAGDEPAANPVPAHWPAQTTALPRDGLQAVGFQPGTRR